MVPAIPAPQFKVPLGNSNIANLYNVAHSPINSLSDLGDGNNNFFSSHFAPAKTPKKWERSVSVTSIMNTKPAVGTKKIKGLKRHNNKENQCQIDKAMNAAMEVDGVLVTGCPWLDTDKTKLFIWLFGAEGDTNFKIHKKDPAQIYKKVSLNSQSLS